MVSFKLNVIKVKIILQTSYYVCGQIIVGFGCLPLTCVAWKVFKKEVP